MEEIRSRLAYREENKKKLAKFFPHLTFEGSKNVYINPWNEEFIVTDLSDRHEGNPDLIRFSQVSSVHTEIKENKEELFCEDSDCKRKSHELPRHECDYAFNVRILVDSPWFDLIELELSEGNRPNSPYTDLYQEYERKMHKLSDILCRRDEEYRVFDGDDLMHRTVCRNKGREEIESASTPAPQPKSGKTWVCPSCGTETNSKNSVQTAVL